MSATNLFSPNGFPARWVCGWRWHEDPWIGWVSIAANLATFGAYAWIAYALWRSYRHDGPRHPVLRRSLLMFAVFVAACGIVHGIEPVMFWHPAYGIKAVAETFMAVVSVVAAAYVYRSFGVIRQLRTEIQADFEIPLTVWKTSPSGFARVAADGRFLAVNPAFRRITGYSESQLLSMRYQDITHPDDLGNDVALHAEMQRGERYWYQIAKRYERAPRGSGWYFWIRLTASMPDGSDEAIAQIEDIDREQRIRARLEERLAELQALAEQRTSQAEFSDHLGQLASEWAQRDGDEGGSHAGREV